MSSREIIRPRDRNHWLELRANDITSTEISALFNLSPYTTEYELWHHKKSKTIVELEPNERMTWGTRLQEAIAKGMAEDNGWHIRLADEYIRDVSLRIGSSFDYRIQTPLPGGTPRGEDTEADSILEIKNVDSLIHKQKWVETDEGIEAPPHIELQVQHQMLVSGLTRAYIGAFIGGNKVILIKRTADIAIQDAIKSKAAAFWASIDSNTPPTINFERDAEFIASLYNFAEPGKVLDLEGDAYIAGLAMNYREIGERAKSLEKNREAIKAELLMKIGNAEKVLGGQFTISSGVVGPARIEYDRKGYRMFKINWKKTKES